LFIPEEALKNYNLLLKFLKGDSQVPDGMRWHFSIQSKLAAIEILRTDVLRQIPKCLTEEKCIREKGYGDGIEARILAIKYEVFLNSIYALCENLSYIAWCLLDKKVPRHFNDQKKLAKADKLLDPNYGKLLSSSSWYDEIHLMRSESTHYLSGFITYANGTQVGYYNVPKSKRGTHVSKIQIDNIEEHVNHLFADLLLFLAACGNYFITIIRSEFRVSQVCLYYKGLLGAKMISLKEFLNNEPGECQTQAFDCPQKNSCKARKNDDE
jgi:hypothetical protein